MNDYFIDVGNFMKIEFGGDLDQPDEEQNKTDEELEKDYILLVYSNADEPLKAYHSKLQA